MGFGALVLIICGVLATLVLTGTIKLPFKPAPPDDIHLLVESRSEAAEKALASPPEDQALLDDAAHALEPVS